MTTCKECKYYFVETSQATYTSLGETPRQQTFTNKFIECRRYPNFIRTEDDYWCGEFVGKTDKSNINKNDLILGGYYRTHAGQQAHATFREPDGCEPMITGHVLRDSGARRVSWTLGGLSYGSPDDNLRPSTYQPHPFEE